MKRHLEDEVGSSKKAKRNSASFSVIPMEQFVQKFPFYRKPMEIGKFSLDLEREFHDDDRQLRFYTPPKKIEFDLSVGYKEFMRRDEDKKEKLDHLLQWINLHKDRFLLKGENMRDCRSIHTDFVSWRGHFTKIFCTPYESKEPWQLAASLFKGTIYISEVETAEERKKRQNVSARQDEMCYWGIKFEDYVTTPRGTKSRQDEDNNIVNQNEAFVTVIRTRMNKHSIVVGAEVDCCRKESTKSPPDNYIELKTSRHIEHPKQNWTFSKFKLIKWWSQSFLAGIPDIICGFRNDNGVVEELRTYKTLDIPHVVQEQEKQEGRKLWDAAVCLNFCDKLLEWMKNIVVKDDPKVVYMFYWKEPFTHISVEEIHDEDSVFLPDWYTDSFPNKARI